MLSWQSASVQRRLLKWRRMHKLQSTFGSVMPGSRCSGIPDGGCLKCGRQHAGFGMLAQGQHLECTGWKAKFPTLLQNLRLLVCMLQEWLQFRPASPPLFFCPLETNPLNPTPTCLCIMHPTAGAGGGA